MCPCAAKRDLGFLRREVAECLDRPCAGVLARSLELDARAFGERFHAEVGEHLVRDSKLFTSVHPTGLAPEPLSVEQVRAGQVDRDARAG